MSSMYVRLGIALAISWATMWLMSFSMIRQLDHWEPSLSNAYMALIMVAPMGLIMLAVMWRMFESRILNVLLGVGFVALWGLALFLGRTEAMVEDEQFMRSMIPHHSRAILVCQESDLSDPEVIELCDAIVQTQREEIDQMKGILDDRY